MVRMAFFGSVILTVAAIVASYPAISFLLMYSSDLEDSGALMVVFSLLCLRLFFGVNRVGVGLRSIRLESLEPM